MADKAFATYVDERPAVTNPVSTDDFVVLRAGAVATMTRSELEKGLAVVLPPVAIAGNTNITAALHANRILNVTSLAALTIAPGHAFADGDAIIVRQVGAGVATMQGLVETAPGVTALATGGNKSQLSLMYDSALGKMVIVDPQADTVGGGGGGGAVVVANYANAVAPADTSENAVRDLALPAIAAGSKVSAHVLVNSPNTGEAGNFFIRVYLGASEIGRFQNDSGVGGLGGWLTLTFLCPTQNLQLARTYLPNFSGWVDGGALLELTENTASGLTLSVRVQKTAGARVVSVRAVRVEIEA